MLSGKFLMTLIGLVVAILAICKMDFGAPVVENWDGFGQLQQRAVPAAYNPKTGQETALGVSILNETSMGSGKFIQAPPNLQGILNPRFINTQMGANIRYNMPATKNMAAESCNPLTFGKMASEENFTPRDEPVRENFKCGSAGCGLSCGKGGVGMGQKGVQVGNGYELPSGYAAGNYWAEYDKIQPMQENAGANLPVGTMSTIDGAGNEAQFVTFNRMMFSNKKSRKLKDSDWIRGDLAITPCNQGWFSVYPDIAADLNPGAMGVLAGASGLGETNAATMKMLLQATGGTKTTWGGIDLADSNLVDSAQQGAQITSSLSSAISDVQATAFP